MAGRRGAQIGLICTPPPQGLHGRLPRWAPRSLSRPAIGSVAMINYDPAVHAVVNRPRFREPIDPALFEGVKRDLASQMRTIEGFEAFHVIRTSERDAVLVIMGRTRGLSTRSRPRPARRGCGPTSFPSSLARRTGNSAR